MRTDLVPAREKNVKSQQDFINKLQQSKLKASIVGPCVGTGGADALALSLVKFCYNIDWTGVGIDRECNVEQLQWARAMCGNSIEFFQTDQELYNVPALTYCPTFGDMVYASSLNADVLIIWCTSDIFRMQLAIDKPIVEIAQNTDEFARTIAASNKIGSYKRVACCKAAVEAYPEELREDVTVIYNGIDPGRVTPRYGRELTRQMWGLTEEDKLLVFAGRMVDEKVPASLLQALSVLPKNWKGLYVGKGYNTENTLKEAERWIEPQRVLFMDAQYHVGDILAASDVYLLTSDFEGHPLGVCEAWLAALPVVTTNVGSMPELQEDYGKLATYIPQRADAETLAGAVIRASSGSEEVQLEIATARALTWDKFTMPAIAVLWEELLHDTVDIWRMDKRRPRVMATNGPRVKHSPHTIITKVEAE